jgi:hypothetical protein
VKAPTAPNQNNSNHSQQQEKKEKKNHFGTKKKEFNINSDWCWSHGLTGHSSEQCHRRYENHKTEAT